MLLLAQLRRLCAAIGIAGRLCAAIGIAGSLCAAIGSDEKVLCYIGSAGRLCDAIGSAEKVLRCFWFRKKGSLLLVAYMRKVPLLLVRPW